MAVTDEELLDWLERIPAEALRGFVGDGGHGKRKAQMKQDVMNDKDTRELARRSCQIDKDHGVKR